MTVERKLELVELEINKHKEGLTTAEECYYGIVDIMMTQTTE